MKKLQISIIVSAMAFVFLFQSCNNNNEFIEDNALTTTFSSQEIKELKELSFHVDDLVKNITKEKDLNKAYFEYFKNIKNNIEAGKKPNKVIIKLGS